MEFFAVSQPGLEEVTKKEIEELGIEGRAVPGGVIFSGSFREIYLTNLWLRSATRVLLRLCSFRALHFAELVRKAKRCKWEKFISQELPVKFRVTSKRSKLYHTKGIEERILRAIEERLGFEPRVARFEDEGTSVVVRVENNVFTISVNTSGAPLYKRGYRVAETEAPLRENIAAGIILMSNWRGEIPLIDPFCGSGTIPIEGALIASNTPPGKNRKFAFMEWKSFNRELWNELLYEAESRKREIKVPILGFDIEPKAVEASLNNAEAAGVSEFVEFKNLSFPEVRMERALIVTNPPYGVRLSERRLGEVYAKFGEWVEKSFKYYSVYFLSPSRRLAEKTLLNLELLTYLSNGGIRVGLYRASNFPTIMDRNYSEVQD
ncbi:MAG: class I SAM-dependent RNA methyltransferase [Thermovibrio sp.]|nr:MAG: class I SAM-dependent RNA methyltransferase [Thermovibrio sp.]